MQLSSNVSNDAAVMNFVRSSFVVSIQLMSFSDQTIPTDERQQ